MELSTPRLLLRRWRPEDRESFARLNADPKVMEFYPARLSREESDALIDRIERHFEVHGFGLWAAERRDVPDSIGYIGLLVADFPAPFTPCVEIGWRLAAEHWGQGLATEGAREVLRYGFATLALEEIVSFTTVANARSRRVMEKIGLRHDPADDFDHPNLPEGHRLRRHVLYRAKREEWLRDSAESRR
jgi:RimJ/RimL family protein N-acetyltransferase